MRRTLVEADHWRHYVPDLRCSSIEITVESGGEFYYSLPHDTVLQGAKDPVNSESPSIDLSITPAQRGWRIVFVPITLPLRGTVQSTADGFVYKSFDPLYEGTDSFNYILSNGTQESVVGTVNIKLRRKYYNEVFVEKHTWKSFTFNIGRIIANGVDIPEGYAVTTYIERPASVYNERLDRNQVEIVKELVNTYELFTVETHHVGAWFDDRKHTSSCRWDTFIGDDGRSFYHDFISDHGLRDLPVGDTDIPYIPTGNLGRLTFVVTMWMNDIGHAPIERYTFDMATVYGDRWWESGNFRVKSDEDEKE